MSKEQQLENYQDVLHSLERMPPSPHRDWLIALVREQILQLEQLDDSIFLHP